MPSVNLFIVNANGQYGIFGNAFLLHSLAAFPSQEKQINLKKTLSEETQPGSK